MRFDELTGVLELLLLREEGTEGGREGGWDSVRNWGE
jgi:hypothetical protein